MDSIGVLLCVLSVGSWRLGTRLQFFLTLASVDGEWSVPCPDGLIPEWEAGWAPELIWRSLLLLLGIEPRFPGCLARNIVSIRTELARLTYWFGNKVKGKGKVIPITGLCGPEGG